MTSDAVPLSPLFDDNPAVRDLLGFGSVAEAVVRVLIAGGLDPVTVGVTAVKGSFDAPIVALR